jgi:cytochrome c
MMQHKCSIPVLALAFAGAMTSAAVAAGDPVKGKAVFEQCAACHSLAVGQNGVGPSLHGLFGRKSGSEDDFAYSAAMRRANITWTPEQLDRYLADPQGGVFRGNRMPFAGIPDPEMRADLIAYLEEATK